MRIAPAESAAFVRAPAADENPRESRCSCPEAEDFVAISEPCGRQDGLCARGGVGIALPLQCGRRLLCPPRTLRPLWQLVVVESRDRAVRHRHDQPTGRPRRTPLPPSHIEKRRFRARHAHCAANRLWRPLRPCAPMHTRCQSPQFPFRAQHRTRSHEPQALRSPVRELSRRLRRAHAPLIAE